MAGIPTPQQGYSNQSSRYGSSTTPSHLMVQPTTPSSIPQYRSSSNVSRSTSEIHRMEQNRSEVYNNSRDSKLKQPRVEPRRAPPSEETRPRYTATSSNVVTPTTGGSRPLHPQQGLWHTPHASQNVFRGYNDDGVGTRSCLTFPKHLPQPLRFLKPSETRSTTKSHATSSTATTTASKRRWNRTARSDRGVIITSSQSSQNSSTAANPTIQIHSNDRHQYLSDDEYYSDNINSWLLKESITQQHATSYWGVPGGGNGNRDRSGLRENPSTAPPAAVTPEINHEAPPPPVTTPISSHLFSLPPVEDRSERRRMDYEQRLRNSTSSSQRRRGLYDGELEPEGVRGQEASVTPGSTVGSSPALPSSTPNTLHILQPVIPGLSKQSLVNIPEESHDSSSASYDPVMNDPSPALAKTPLHQNRPSRLVPPPPSRISSSRHYQSRRIVPTAPAIVKDTTTIDRNEPAQHVVSPIQKANQDDDDNDIPWMRSSQRVAARAEQQPPPPIRPLNSMDTESSVGAPHWNPRDPPSTAPDDTLPRDLEEPSTATIEQLQDVASNAVRSGDLNAAAAAFNTILKMQLDRHGRTHAATAAAYHNLGTVYAKQATAVTEDPSGDPTLQQTHFRTAALECFQAAARCARDASPDSEHPHPNVAVSLVRVGFLLLQSKQYPHAIVTFQEALRIRVAHYGKLHALSANLYNNLGVCCLHMGEFDQGLYHLEQALEIQRHLVSESGRGSPKHQGNESAIGAHQLELADTLFNIGGLCLEWMRRQGPDARRADEAEAAFAECLQLRTRVLGPAHPQTLQVKSLYGIAQSVPRPRRIMQASSSPHGASNSPKNRVPSSKRESAPPKPLSRNIDFSEGAWTRRSKESSKSPIKIPSMSPIGPLSEVSSIMPDDSQEVSIFRLGSTNNTSPLRSLDVRPKSSSADHRSSGNTVQRQPPLLQITVSREEDEAYRDLDPELNKVAASEGTHIYIAPHLIPGSPIRPISDDSGEVQVNGSSYEKDGFTVDTSSELPDDANKNTIPLPHVSSYDAEENCLISDTGVDSEIGRIHYPFAWNRAGIMQTSSSNHPSATHRDIMVAQPVRPVFDGKKLAQVKHTHGDQSDKIKRNAVVTTGNSDRDDILAKARAILNAYSTDGEVVQPKVKDDEDNNTKPSEEDEVAVENDIDDGIASLGGDWGPKGNDKRHKSKATVPVRDMLHDPMLYLPEIHEEASKQLKDGNAVDAFRLFDVVLQCQRHLHGPLHPDVAAALHNIGIVHLRAQNHEEALKAFEEAARVRKGSLGKDHPLVAVSLVKVGISLLLLHRFDEALWSFREALSVRKHTLGPLHPSTARIYNNIGCVYVEFNEFKEARRAFEAALDVQRNALCNDPDNGPLMFGTATTLCNLGYLYRYRDMHGKAVAVLEEAVELQERVLGPLHATVLSTMDNLADSCANSGNAAEALKHYNVVLHRFLENRSKQGGDQNAKLYRAEAVLLYKMSRVHRRQNNRTEQLNLLKQALQAIRQHSASSNGRTDTLERRIYYDIRACREQSEKDELKWI